MKEPMIINTVVYTESISIEAYNFIRSALCEQEAYHEGEVYSNESAYTQFI